MKIGGKEIKLRPGAWILLPALILAWIAPIIARVQASQITDTFDDLSGWTVTSGAPIANGALRFTYYNSSVTKTIAVPGAGTLTASIDIDNSATNCIGSCAPIPDTYAFYLGDAHIDSSTAHGVTRFTQSVTTTAAGNVVLYLAGIDNGFWGGYYGPVMDSLSYEFVPTPTSLVVTSLEDTTSSGTLRWAITQANATAGGIYDAITFGVNGTITLTSALPQITQNLTVAGNGRTQTVISGSNAHRPFNIASTKSLTISDMTLQNGQLTNGGLIFNGSGNLSATNMRFTGMSGGSAVFNNNNGSVSTLTNTTFDSLYIGIAGDYGSTPSALSLDDASYTNRTYVYSSVFSGNSYGISGQRFVKINNSQFSNNTQAGALLGGLNRQQVTNSVFTSNGTGVYLSSWIPTSWAVGAGNQTVSGNTFNGNTTAIQFANNWNNGSSVYNGVSANSFSTATNNTFGAGATNTTAFSGSGYVESGNTVIAPYFNLIQNLTATANENGSATLTWTAPAASNTAPYMYGVYWYDLTVIGGAESGGWAVWTYANTLTYTVNPSAQTEYGPVRFKVRSGTAPCIGEGAGSCLYSADVFVDVTISDPTPPTTTTEPETTTSENTTTTTEVIQEPEISTTIPLPVTGTTSSTVDETTTTVMVVPEIIPIIIPETIPIIEEENVGPGDFTESTVQDSIPEPEAVPQDETPTQETPPELPLDTQDAADAAVADIFDGPMSDAVLANAVDDLITDAGTPEELTAVVNSLLDQELTDEQFSTVIDSVFDGPMSDDNFSAAVDAVFEDTSTLSNEQFDTAVQAVFDGPLSTEQFGDALDAVFDEPVTDEKFDAVISAVLDEPLSDEQFEELVGVLESENVTEEQVEDAVDSMIENGVTEDQATELATSEKVLESISSDAASEIFNEIPVDELSDEQGQEIVDAVQDAPTEIKEAFEEEINVFDGAFDTYVPTDSSISVGERRTVVAVTVVSSVIAVSAASAPSAPSGPSGGNSGPSGGSPGGGDTGGGSTPSEDKGKNKSRGRRRK